MTKKIVSGNIEEKTLNFHFTDKCNFHCKHCFINMNNRELSLENCKIIIDKVYKKKFYRINIAGGEPMMSPNIQNIIDYVVQKGLKCSIITNGSFLTKEFINANKEKLCMIGISIDSMDDEINKLIGRQTIRDIKNICNEITKAKIKLKINICVSKLNLNYDFSPLIDAIKPNRLKIFQLLPTKNLENPNDLVITKQEFLEFCNKYKKYAPICEDNEYMMDHYWIVDSEGYYSKNNFHDDKSKKEKLI